MAKVNLALLTRAQLERLVFTTNRTLRRVVETVRERTKPEWGVAREVEKVLADFDVKIEPVRDRTAVERIAQARAQQRAERNAHYWQVVSDGDGNGNGHASH